MITFLFWSSLLLLFYIYIGYPILVKLLSAADKRIAKDEGYLPKVSILIAAYNEEKDIEHTIRNKIALDYPRELMEILVVSDESTDRTDALVESLAAEAPFPIRLVRQTPRQGKTAGLNLIAPLATGEILVFSDANSLYEPDALRKLVRNFADPEVGYVTGKMIYANPDGSVVGDGCSAYMRYENWLREKETRIGSVVGVDGGIDAIRARLFKQLNADQLPDFVQPLKVNEQGYRVIYEPEAVLKELALDDSGREFRMRVRVSLRALWALHDMKQLLNPFQYGLFAIQLISHKLLRYLAFIPLLWLGFANLLLLGQGGIYLLFFFGQILFYVLAWLGRSYDDEKNRPFYLTLPYYFCLLNVASAHAAWRYVKGEKQVIWAPRVG